LSVNGSIYSVYVLKNVPEGEELLEDQGVFHTHIVLQEVKEVMSFLCI